MGDATKSDQLLTMLGTGPWNILHFIACAAWSTVLPIQLLNMIFIAPALSYSCLPHHNTTAVANDSCSYTRLAADGVSEKEEPCTEWEFDRSVFKTTLTEEFGLVCGRGHLRVIAVSIYTIAGIFGGLVTGYITDRYGRKKMGIMCVTVYAIAGTLISLVHNLYAILFLRFVVGAFHTPILYLHSIEVCQLKHRSLLGILMGLPWALGFMLLGAMGYGIRTWRYLQLAGTLPVFLIILLLLITNEPPRWLIVKGRHREALRVLQRAARWNQVTLPPESTLRVMISDIEAEALNPCHGTDEDLKEEVWLHKDRRRSSCTVAARTLHFHSSLTTVNVKEGKSFCAHDAFKLVSTAKMRLVLFILMFAMCACSVIYYGISFNADGYSNDPFLFIILAGLMEVPGYALSTPIVAKWGRRLPISIGYFVTGAVLLSLAFVPRDISWLMMTLALVGKIFVTATFMMTYFYSAEVFPTEVRVQGTAYIIVATQTAASLAPYIIALLNPILPWLPSIIFGITGFVASLLMLPMPETLGQNLPDTIHDLDRLWTSPPKMKDFRTGCGRKGFTVVKKLED